MQAIVTKFIGATNTRGARVKATAQANNMTLAWDYQLHVPENHARAAQALAIKLGWEGAFVGGGTPDDKGYAYVMMPSKPDFTVVAKKAG